MAIQNIEINTDLFSKEAVINAAYRFTGDFYVKPEQITESIIAVSFTAKDDKNNPEEIVNQFYNELIDQQIRIMVEKDYKIIREEIVKKAFSVIN